PAGSAMFIASGALREPTFARGACDGSSCIEYYVLQQASCDPEKNQEREEAPPKEKHISIGETVSAANPDAKHCAPKRDARSAANPQHVPIIEGAASKEMMIICIQSTAFSV